jgi:hypothetical protein
LARPDFDAQFTLPREHYLETLDMVSWLRHYHVLRDILAAGSGDVLEVGTGDGIVRRCVEPFVASYRVLDVNPNLDPEVLGDFRDSHPALAASCDTVIATEVMEHMPFKDMPACLENLRIWLRPGGRAIVSLPHRKSSIAVLTPRQNLRVFRFPNGLLSASEAYNRFVRRRIWIDPHHVWEIGDGQVSLRDVEQCFLKAGLIEQRRTQLPYSDYWVLTNPLTELA